MEVILDVVEKHLVSHLGGSSGGVFLPRQKWFWKKEARRSPHLAILESRRNVESRTSRTSLEGTIVTNVVGGAGHTHNKK